MERNIFPEIDLFPRLTQIAQFLGRLLTPLPTQAPPHMSEHYRAPDAEGEAYQPTLFEAE